jgi:E3 ubiquitin-protein ligase DOA10
LASVNNERERNRCRFCLSSSESEEDPLISPCKCMGSVKYTHLKCLSNWLFDLSVDQQEYIRIRVNKSICELCKTDITGLINSIQSRPSTRG